MPVSRTQKRRQRSNKQRLLALDKKSQERPNQVLRLPSKETCHSSKHTVFSDSSYDEDNAKLTLFAGDLSDEDSPLEVAEKYKGEKGEKLLHLQRQIGVDKRFQLNKTFLESDDDSESDGHSEVEIDVEKDKSLAVIRSILGETSSVLHVRNKPKNSESLKDIIPLRYDPRSSNHKEFEQVAATSVGVPTASKHTTAVSSKDEETHAKDTSPSPQSTSQTKFYLVNADLKNLFSSTGHEFGFLGNTSDKEQETDSVEGVVSHISTPLVAATSEYRPADQIHTVDTDHKMEDFKFFLSSSVICEHSFYCVDSQVQLEGDWANKRTVMKDSFRKRRKDAMKIVIKSRRYT